MTAPASATFAGVLPSERLFGVPLGPDYPEHERGLLVAITEQRSLDDVERLAVVLEDAVASCADLDLSGSVERAATR